MLLPASIESNKDVSAKHRSGLGFLRSRDLGRFS